MELLGLKHTGHLAPAHETLLFWKAQVQPHYWQPVKVYEKLTADVQAASNLGIHPWALTALNVSSTQCTIYHLASHRL